MAPERIGNGWRNLQTLLLIATLAVLFLKEFIMPNVNSGKLADTVQTHDKKIAVLEDILPSLRPLPSSVDGLKIMVDSIKRQLDRFEITLEKHVDKGK